MRLDRGKPTDREREVEGKMEVKQGDDYGCILIREMVDER